MKLWILYYEPTGENKYFKSKRNLTAYLKDWYNDEKIHSDPEEDPFTYEEFVKAFDWYEVSTED